MDFLFINTHELSALRGLPHCQQLTYLLGIRPYMDRQTFVVGIKRRISYQSLSETLYVEPHQGIKSGSPSREQLRRIIKGLERAGLIQIQSSDKHLILKCVLAASDNSVQNKADTNPTPQADILNQSQNSIQASAFDELSHKGDMGDLPKADIPHNSEDNNIFLCKKFEKFWESYPQPKNKPQAKCAFEKLNPDDVLFSKILTALNTQVQHYQKLQAEGHWVPAWKYPANWIAQQCWNDELLTPTKQEFTHATRSATHAKKSSIDMFWESCKGGADFDFDEDTSTSIDRTNLIELNSRRH